MRVRVGAAKRPDVQVTIFDQPLDFDQILLGSDGEVEITFLASGMYDPKSRYRYTMKLSKDELMALTGTQSN